MAPAVRPVFRVLAAIAVVISSLIYVADSDPANASTAPSTPRVNKFLATGPNSLDVQPQALSGGGAPTSLTVTVVEDPSKSCTVATSLSWCTISGLFPDQPYTLQATASNAFGTSLPSTPTQAVTTPTDLYTVGAGPQGVAITSDKSYAIVANYDVDSVSRINLADETVVTVSVGNGPLQVALDGTYAYVTNVVTPVVVDGQAAVLRCAASARAWAGVRSPSEACGRSLL
jgi:DNA-binding beta-propeller fold protein YncE